MQKFPDFETRTSCDLVVNIKDKVGLVSENQNITVVVQNINDPPHARYGGGCAVDENTQVNQQLAKHAFCRLMTRMR